MPNQPPHFRCYLKKSLIQFPPLLAPWSGQELCPIPCCHHIGIPPTISDQTKEQQINATHFLKRYHRVPVKRSALTTSGLSVALQFRNASAEFSFWRGEQLRTVGIGSTRAATDKIHHISLCRNQQPYQILQVQLQPPPQLRPSRSPTIPCRFPASLHTSW